jgi:uncharacterized membrane protein
VNTLKVSIVATLVALCVTTNYALVGVPNIKAMDFIVFIGGFCFGAYAGAFIGIFSWAVYGVLNPYGFVPQVWLATMFSEAIYGLLGGLLRKKLPLTNFDDVRLRLSIFFGAIGFISTLFYDLVTNVVYASVFEVSIIVAIFFGAPFTILHQVSNAAIFGVSTVPVITVLKKLLRGERVGVSKK